MSQLFFLVNFFFHVCSAGWYYQLDRMLFSTYQQLCAITNHLSFSSERKRVHKANLELQYQLYNEFEWIYRNMTISTIHNYIIGKRHSDCRRSTPKILKKMRMKLKEFKFRWVRIFDADLFRFCSICVAGFKPRFLFNFFHFSSFSWFSICSCLSLEMRVRQCYIPRHSMYAKNLMNHFIVSRTTGNALIVWIKQPTHFGWLQSLHQNRTLYVDVYPRI